MEPGTKKGILIGCGCLVFLVLASCVVLIVLFSFYGKELMMWTGTFVQDQMVEGLPEGTDKEKARQLVQRAWEQFMTRQMEGELNQNSVNEFMNSEFNPAIQDGELSSEEFSNLLTSANDVFFKSSWEEETLQQIESIYSDAMEDGQVTSEEVNEMLPLIEEALNSSEEAIMPEANEGNN